MFDFEDRARPLLKWAGGKSSLLPQLTIHFPQNFNRYVEPFFGGGAVYFALRNTNIPAILNDRNQELFNLYLVAKNHPTELMNALNTLTKKYSEQFYYELRSENPDDAIEKAARTVFLNKTGFNGLYRQNSKGNFNVPFGKRVTCPALYDYDNLMLVSQKLEKTDFKNLDFEEIIKQSGEGDFVYCDPPYEPLSTTSSFNAYTAGGFSQNDQVRLRDACAAAVQRGAFVAVSNSSAEFIKEIYKEWNVRIIKAKRNINSKASARGEIDEVLVLMTK